MDNCENIIQKIKKIDNKTKIQIDNLFSIHDDLHALFMELTKEEIKKEYKKMDKTRKIPRRLTKEEKKRVRLLKLIDIDGMVFSDLIVNTEIFNYIDVIGHINANFYIFEAYHLEEEKNTEDALHYIGTLGD